jgi:hypothetical protein
MRFAYGLNITWSKPRFAIGAGGFNESIVWRRENREQSNTLLLLRSRKMMYSFLFFMMMHGAAWDGLLTIFFAGM